MYDPELFTEKNELRTSIATATKVIKALPRLKIFLFDFLKPSIVEYLRAKNPERMDEWQNNCCRQTSLITNWYLREILLRPGTGYKDVQSWQGLFFDTIEGKRGNYDHAWNYCKHEDPRFNIFIDIGRNHKELLCLFRDENTYPEHPDYRDMYLLDKQQMLHRKLWKEQEYFTGELIEDIIPKLTKYMAQQSLFKLKVQ